MPNAAKPVGFHPPRRCGLRTAWACALALCLGWVQRAHASEPAVLVLEPRGAPSGLMSALGIQLVGLAEPRRVSQPRAAGSAERIDAAAELARAERALAVIWVERPRRASDGSHQVILYVVGEREGRALVEVVRVPGDRGPELERTLALKVREIVAELRRSRARGPQEAMLLPSGTTDAEPETAGPPVSPTQPPPALSSEPVESEPQPEAAGDRGPVWSGAGGIGFRLGTQPRLGLRRWGIHGGLGPALRLRDVRFAGLLDLEWFPVVEAVQTGGNVQFWELAGAIALHAQLRAGRLWLGAYTGPQLLWVHALGTTPLPIGTQGEPHAELLGAWTLGATAELPIGAELGVLADLQLQTLFRRRGFTVNGSEIVDLGSARVRLGLTLTYRPFE